jgi:HK97 family phage prohead protease
MATIRKTTESAAGSKKTFVWSTPRPDSYDDIVGDINHPNLGWDLADFNRNPICLLGHNSRDIVGRWENPRIEKSALVGDLVFAPKGASAVADEARILVECGILRACSVGFAVVKSEPRGGGSSGKKYTRMILREVSLCALGANADALLQAKAKGVSKAMIVKIFRDQTKIARRIDKHYSAQEKAEVMRRAEKLLGKKITQNKELPPLVSPAQRLKNEQQAYNNEVMKRALARVAVIRAERAAARRLEILARQDPPPYESTDYISWRGQKIPVPTWRGKKQW